MFDTRVVYVSSWKNSKPILNFRKWFVIDGKVTNVEYKRENITHSSWKRINLVLRKSKNCTHSTSASRIWIGVWFDEKVYLD